MVPGSRRMQPLGGVVTLAGAAPDRRPCCTVLGEVALAASATGPGRPVRSTVETSPTAAASPMLAPSDCKARLDCVLEPDEFAPSRACVAAALISGVAGIVFLPPQAAARIVAAIRIRRIVWGSLVESVRNAIEHGLHGRRHKTDADHVTRITPPA